MKKRDGAPAKSAWAQRLPTFHEGLRAARRGAGAVRAGATRAAALALPAAVVGSVLLAYHARFLQDDAYISFRYAKHLVEGHGLVFNVGGPRTEGYTNFLYTLLVAAGMALGARAEDAALVIGLAAHAATLAVVARTARALGAPRGAALAAVATLAQNPTFSSYGTGGLETSLATFLALEALALAVTAPEADCRRTFAAVSVLFALATMTRPDAGVPVVAALAVVTWARRPSAREAAALALPAALLLGAWAAFKLGYHGSLLPNAFYAKRIADASRVFGARYVGTFLWTNGLAVALAVAAASARRARASLDGAAGGPPLPSAHRGPDVPLRALWAALVAVLAYVAWAGGDFMEYRLLVPAMPLAAVLFAVTAFRAPGLPAFAVAAALLGASLARVAKAPGFGLPPGVETIAALRGHVQDPDVGWVRVGSVLGDVFEHDPSISIAVRPAGAIPFASDLPALDMLGLNDAWVAHHGVPAHYPGMRGGYRPGHAVTAPLDYLVQSGVTLVLAHPIVVRDGTKDLAAVVAGDRYFADLGFGRAPCRIVVVPLGNGYDLLAWYLTPSERADALIAAHGLRVVTAGPGRER